VDWVLLIGRILFVAIFVMSGLTFHIMGRAVAVPYSRSMGAPFPELMVPLTGLAIAGAGILVVLGIWVDLAALVLAANVFAFAFFIHAFWKVEDPQQRQMEQTQFMKDSALGGAALILFYLFQQFGEEIGLVIGPAALFD
jgi:putative oxidoreductase